MSHVRLQRGEPAHWALYTRRCKTRPATAPAISDSSNLLEPLDRDERSQRLALAFDDEFVASEGDPVEHVADTLADINGGHFFSHDHV